MYIELAQIVANNYENTKEPQFCILILPIKTGLTECVAPMMAGETCYY